VYELYDGETQLQQEENGSDLAGKSFNAVTTDLIAKGYNMHTTRTLASDIFVYFAKQVKCVRHSLTSFKNKTPADIHIHEVVSVDDR
jgi:hypothetical protein